MINLVEDIKDIQDQEFVGEAIKFDKLKPYMRSAQNKFVKPLMASLLVDGIAEELKTAARAVVVPMGMALAVPMLITKITDNGVHTTKSQKIGQAWGWQIKAKIEGYITQANIAMVELYDLLSAAAAWEEKNDFTTDFFTSPRQFSKYLFIDDNPFMYYRLLPYIKDVEEGVLTATLGDDYDAVKALATTELNAKLVRKAIARLAAADAIENTLFSVSPTGNMILTEFESITSQGSGEKISQPNSHDVALQASRIQAKGLADLKQLAKDLNPEIAKANFTNDSSRNWGYFGGTKR